jgi:hypothetical protein
LRATLPRTILFLFSINNNRPAAAHLVQKNPKCCPPNAPRRL